MTVDSSSGCTQTALTGNGNDDKNYYQCGSINTVDFDGIIKKEDEDVDELLQSVLRKKKVYSVVVVNGGGKGEGIRAVVGKYRHAWIIGKFEEEDGEVGLLVSRIVEIFVKLFSNGGRDKGSIPAEFMPVGADGRIVLSFNLLNANPSDWVYDWYSTCCLNKIFDQRAHLLLQSKFKHCKLLSSQVE